MTAILNTAILNLAIFDSSILVCPLKLNHTCQDWFPPFEQKNFTHFFWLNLMIAAILNSANLNSTILDSTILVFPLKLTHTCQDWFPHLHKKYFTHSFWLNLMMAAILNLASLGFNHLSFSSQTHSHLPRLVPNICTKKLHWFVLTQLDDCSYLEICHPQFSHFVQKILHSFILTQLDDGSHPEFGNLGFNHLSLSSQTHSHLPILVPNICTKKLHSFILTQLDDCSYLEICHPQFSHFVQKILHSFILTQLDDGSHIEFCHLGFSHFAQKELHSFILTQLDDGSHLEFCHVRFRLCHLGFKHLVIFSQIH